MVKVRIAAQLGPPDERFPGGPVVEEIVMFDGEVVDRDDPDALIDAFEKVREIEIAVDALKAQLRKAIAQKTTGDTKTRYLQGKRRKAKIVFPDDQWDQGKLREAYHTYPQYRDDYLRIQSLGVKLIEFRKLERTTGEPSLNLFRNMITNANRGPQGLPTVSILG